MKREELRTHYRDRIIALAEKRGAYNVRVFGSVARGEEHAESDVDFLVDFKPGRSLLDLTGLWLDLESVPRGRHFRPRFEAARRLRSDA